jgi:shikimate dehydrogenase
MSRKFGLIGKSLSHSFSASYFARKFDELGIQDSHSYELLEFDDEKELSQFLNLPIAYNGFNVTNPYKMDVAGKCDILVGYAARSGAVNTVVVKREKLIGFNTDVYGLKKTITDLKTQIKNALILGTGGAAKAVCLALDDLRIDHKSISRREKYTDYTYKSLAVRSKLSDFQLIINATPVGMYPEIQNKPSLNYYELNQKNILFDLIYNPQKSLFLKEGEKRGCTVINGTKMLYGQADLSWHLWSS